MNQYNENMNQCNSPIQCLCVCVWLSDCLFVCALPRQLAGLSIGCLRGPRLNALSPGLSPNGRDRHASCCGMLPLAAGRASAVHLPYDDKSLISQILIDGDRSWKHRAAAALLSPPSAPPTLLSLAFAICCWFIVCRCCCSRLLFL